MRQVRANHTEFNISTQERPAKFKTDLASQGPHRALMYALLPMSTKVCTVCNNIQRFVYRDKSAIQAFPLQLSRHNITSGRCLSSW